MFKDLANAGILAVAGQSIPYKASITGEEKDFELKAKSVSLVKQILHSSKDDNEIDLMQI